MKKKKIFETMAFVRMTILTVVVSLLMAGAVWGGEWPKNIRVISPAPGASVHMILVAFGPVVEKYTPAENWIVQPLGGPKLWVPMMKEGKVHFAMQNSADMVNAFLGQGLYKKMGPAPVRQVAAGHGYMFMFWTIPDTGVRGIADLKGKVVYNKFKANPMFDEMTTHQLASAGMTTKDLKASLSFPNIKEGIRDLIEGRVEVLLYPVVPGAVMQLNEAKGETVFVQLTRKQAEYVVGHMPGYFIEDIAPNDPRFRNKSLVKNAIRYQTGMFSYIDTDPDVVYGVVKAIFEHTSEFSDTHPSAKYWSLSHRPVNKAVPYHEGSIRFFKEKGLWTAENQAYQDKMLKEQERVIKEMKGK